MCLHGHPQGTGQAWQTGHPFLFFLDTQLVSISQPPLRGEGSSGRPSPGETAGGVAGTGAGRRARALAEGALSVWGDGKSGAGLWWRLHSRVNVLHATDLYGQTWLQ